MHRWLSCCLLAAALSTSASLVPTNLRCESRVNPLGIDTANPHLSWTLDATDPRARAQTQTAYRVLVASMPDRLQPDRADLWDSGKVRSDQMSHLPYAGRALASGAQAWWTVQVCDQNGEASNWSQPGTWTMGLLHPSDWQANWIYAAGSGDKSGPLPLFRREFELRGPVRRALASICGLGAYEFSLNGQRIGDLVLDPGWTDYRKRCLYTTYDVTGYLQAAAQDGRRVALGVMLGNGMFNVRGGRYVKFTGSFGPPQFILQVHVEFVDGTSTNLVSDRSWRTSPGPIRFSCMYGGEDYDARQEHPGWDQPGFAESSWGQAAEGTGPGGRLAAQSAPPLRIMQTFETQNITEPVPGIFVYDLGQNFAGWPWLEVSGPAGATVKLTPGELLDAKGLISQRSSGGPTWFSYTLKGTGSAESWHPRFSYSGFRYVQVEGAVPRKETASHPRSPAISRIAGQFIHSSAERTGKFACSEELLMQIDRLILAAIESNLQSVLTDCPHREKLGWLEVSHLLGPAIMFNFDVARLYAKICDDIQDAQQPDGLVPDIAPEFTVFQGGFRDSPEWGSAAVLNPWLLYEYYGDVQVLRKQDETMSRYVEYLASKASNHLVTHGLGDWYDIGPKPPGESQLTSKGVTATAIYYRDLAVLSQVSHLLGRESDATRWSNRAEQVRAQFNSTYFHPETGQYDRGSQTANAMPLVLGLVQPAHAAALLDQLVRDVQSHTNQVTAGDVGFRFLVEALRAGGRSDVLFDVVTRLEGPGYADQLRKGATTLTEAWDANPASSQNHCMLGHAAEWFYTGLGGINPDSAGPGFRKIRLAPQIIRSVRWVRAEYRSHSGLIASAWSVEGDQLRCEFTIPPNTSATVTIPALDPANITEGEQRAASAPGIRLLRQEPRRGVFEVGSGKYAFRSRLPGGTER